MRYLFVVVKSGRAARGGRVKKLSPSDEESDSEDVEDDYKPTSTIDV